MSTPAVAALILGLLAVAMLFALIAKTRALRAMEERFRPVLDISTELGRIKAEIEIALRKGELEISSQKAQQEQLASEIASTRAKWSVEFGTTVSEFEALSKQVDRLRDLAELQECGLYEPIFDFDTSEDYKSALKELVAEQGLLIKSGQAAVCDTVWKVEGSEAKGRDMTKRYTKLQLRAFNGEADAAIAKARFDNVSQLEDRISKAWEAINLLGKTNQVRVTPQYRDLKLKELRLAYELANKKQQEKEEQRAIRAQMKEEEEAQREIERAKQEAEKDEARFAKALEVARKEMENVNDAKQEALRKKIALLEKQFEEAHERKIRAISRAQLTRSGHVYIISNMGSLGEDVLKIGMTRRLDPVDRVTELGGASVPFRFDIHAMIYSEDAPTLETELHSRFRSRQVNRVNDRKEFYRVSLEEVGAAVRELCGQDTSFVTTAIAEEFRQSEAIRRKEELEAQAKAQVRVDVEVAAAKDRLAELRAGWKAEPV